MLYRFPQPRKATYGTVVQNQLPLRDRIRFCRKPARLFANFQIFVRGWLNAPVWCSGVTSLIARPTHTRTRHVRNQVVENDRVGLMLLNNSDYIPPVYQHLVCAHTVKPWFIHDAVVCAQFRELGFVGLAVRFLIESGFLVMHIISREVQAEPHAGPMTGIGKLLTTSPLPFFHGEDLTPKSVVFVCRLQNLS